MIGHRQREGFIATFSIVAADLASGDLGIAVASKFLACGAVVPWASAGAGAVATQSFANTAYGPEGIRFMREGVSASEALKRLISEDPDRDLRQVGLVDARGDAAAYTGVGCHGWAGHEVGDGFACQGNLLTGAETVAAMASAFRTANGPLSDCLVAALAAGEAAGGDRRGRQAAALYVARPKGGYLGNNDAFVDLRVDDHPDPVKELQCILKLQHLYFGVSPPEDKLSIDGELLIELKRLMTQRGYYHGPISSDWDTATNVALDKFVSSENFEERIDLALKTIDRPVLEHLQGGE